MTRRPILSALSTLAMLFSLSLAERAQAVPESILVIAGPLAEAYGVSGEAVTGLLENGMSLEGVTQLLLVKQSSGESLDDVTSVYHAQGDSIQKTASELDVAADTYSAENVEAAIAKAKTDAASSAPNKAADATSKAVGSMLGGLSKE